MPGPHWQTLGDKRETLGWKHGGGSAMTHKLHRHSTVRDFILLTFICARLDKRASIHPHIDGSYASLSE